MATNGASFTESIVHAPAGNGSGYPYRAGVGMVSSMEYMVDFDDFVWNVATNVPATWAAAIIDTGATVATYTTAIAGAQGVIQINDATASEGAAIYKPRTVQLTAGKKFFMEARIRTDDVTDNAVQMGLTDLTATTNPEDLWTTTANNVAAFGILDGSATVRLLADLANAGTSVVVGTRDLAVNTWHVLAIAYDGAVLKGYVDGQEAVSTTVTIPVGVQLSPFVGHINGDGAGNNLVLVDYVRVAVER
jgi:hypothetical protein